MPLFAQLLRILNVEIIAGNSCEQSVMFLQERVDRTTGD